MIFTGIEMAFTGSICLSIGFVIGAAWGHSKGYEKGADDECKEQALEQTYNPCGQEHGFGAGWFCTRVRGHDGPCALVSVIERPRIKNRR